MCNLSVCLSLSLFLLLSFFFSFLSFSLSLTFLLFPFALCIEIFSFFSLSFFSLSFTFSLSLTRTVSCLVSMSPSLSLPLSVPLSPPSLSFALLLRAHCTYCFDFLSLSCFHLLSIYITFVCILQSFFHFVLFPAMLWYGLGLGSRLGVLEERKGKEERVV